MNWNLDYSGLVTDLYKTCQDGIATNASIIRDIEWRIVNGTGVKGKDLSELNNRVECAKGRIEVYTLIRGLIEKADSEANYDDKDDSQDKGDYDGT